MSSLFDTCRQSRFRRAEEGSVSLEITLILPTLIILLVLAYASFDVFKVNSQAAKIGYAINDIVSRYQEIGPQEIADLYALQEKMFPPYMDNVKMRISSICFEDEQYRVLWSDVRQPAPDPVFDDDGNPIELTPDIMSDLDIPFVAPLTDDIIPIAIMPTIPPESSVILTELSATYTPPFGFFPIQDLSTRLTIRPRLENVIIHEELNIDPLCPSADEEIEISSTTVPGAG